MKPASRLTNSWGPSWSRWVGSRIRQDAHQAHESAHELVSRLTNSWGRSSTPWVGSRFRERAHRARQPAHEFVRGPALRWSRTPEDPSRQRIGIGV